MDRVVSIGRGEANEVPGRRLERCPQMPVAAARQRRSAGMTALF
jgi:hypothetical protein